MEILTNICSYFGAETRISSNMCSVSPCTGSRRNCTKSPTSLHEIRSEFPESVHEIKSESDRKGRGSLHETESEFREGLHETTSEFDENRRESLHEITSELAERVAERLLEGLRRAAAVR